MVWPLVEELFCGGFPYQVWWTFHTPWCSHCIQLIENLFILGYFLFMKVYYHLNPLMHWGKGGALTAPALVYFRATHAWKFLTLLNLLLRMRLWRKNIKNFVLPPMRGLLFLVGKITHALEGYIHCVYSFTDFCNRGLFFFSLNQI